MFVLVRCSCLEVSQYFRENTNGLIGLSSLHKMQKRNSTAPGVGRKSDCTQTNVLLVTTEGEACTDGRGRYVCAGMNIVGQTSDLLTSPREIMRLQMISGVYLPIIP